MHLFSRCSRCSAQYVFASATETSRTSSRYELQKKECVGAHFAFGGMRLRPNAFPMLVGPVRPSEPSEPINRLCQRRRIRSIRRRFRKSIHNKINRDSYKIWKTNCASKGPDIASYIPVRIIVPESHYWEGNFGRTHLNCALHAGSLLVFVKCCDSRLM